MPAAHASDVDKLWSPNSPGLNPLDYLAWGEVEKASRQSSKEALRWIIQDTMKKMNQSVAKHAYGRFRTGWRG